MSPFGCVVVGVVSGMGGGGIRDILLNSRVSWLRQPSFALLCLGTGLLGAYGWEEVKQWTGITENGPWAKLISVASLGGCTCSGAEAAMILTPNVPGQLAYGAGLAAITATGGGCMRDFLLHRRPGVLYDGLDNAIPAAIGAIAYQTARRAHASLALQTVIAFVTSCGLRSGVRYYNSMKKKRR